MYPVGCQFFIPDRRGLDKKEEALRISGILSRAVLVHILCGVHPGALIMPGFTVYDLTSSPLPRVLWLFVEINI